MDNTRATIENTIQSYLESNGVKCSEQLIRKLSDEYENLQDWNEDIMTTGAGEDEIYEWIKSKDLKDFTVAEKGHIIIITPNDEIINKPFYGYNSISESVDGFVSVANTQKVPIVDIGNGSDIIVDFMINDVCNVSDEDKFDKVNAVATLLLATEIRGNMVLVPHINDYEEPRGFKYIEEDVGGGEIEMGICETWVVEDTLMRCVNQHADRIAELHKEFDRNSSTAPKGKVNNKQTVDR